jgi:orotate phosphoribosyltransferase
LSIDVEEIFRQAGAILEGHFLLSSGRHSPVYWEKFQVLQYPHYTEKLCRLIADHFQGEGIQTVAGPATGGIIIAYEVARQLGVRSIFAESVETLQGSRKSFKRYFPIASGERILIVDDVLTTGGSIYEIVAEVKKLGGEVVGIGVLVDRSTEEIDFGVPFFSCYRTVIPTYSPQECPLCAAAIPLTKPGGSATG